MSISNARKTHVTPGVYTTETEITYSSKSIGITTLGLAGETLRGPAFQPIFVDNWETYTKYFGGTSPEHFKGSKFPKYELPYIAKNYLKDSGQLYVTRVLGLSGYNAGPAWVIKAEGTGDGKDMIVAIIRSRGEYIETEGIGDESDECGVQYVYDNLKYFVDEDKGELTIKPAMVDTISYNCGVGNPSSSNGASIACGPNDYGTFILEGKTIYGVEFSYTVSFNANRQDYIYNVIGHTPDDNVAPIYVEELYDVALEQLILSDDETNCINGISETLEYFPNTPIVKTYNDVNSAAVKPQQGLKSSDVGKRYLFSKKYSDDTNYVIETKDSDGLLEYTSASTSDSDDGKIFVVKKTLDVNGEPQYRYHFEEHLSKQEIVSEGEYVYVEDEKLWFTKIIGAGGYVERVIGDLNNYKSQYRHAETPWIVSEIRGNYGKNDVSKLFKFHTIPDGDVANKLVKVSIVNVDPENLTFDVVVRDFNDIDENIKPLEAFRKLNMNPDSPNYIAQRIGDIENIYPSNSSYILVEVNEDETGRFSFPAGFLGYPVRDLGDNTQKPHLEFNTYWNQEVKSRRQYFGISDRTGIDDDIFSYKGVSCYSDGVFTDGFHLDSRVNDANTTVDGKEGDYTWQVVSVNNVLNNMEVPPKISNADDVINTIYERKDLRKFTVGFYGGFDGWDIYRKQRSNTDDFTYLRYKGDLDVNFDKLDNSLDYNLPDRAITSDYYAYLAAYLTFQNPIETDINLFATPGIDYVNNLFLVDEVIDMIEEDRQDTLYIVTTPDKEMGTNTLYDVDDVVENIEYSEINSSYVCTYYPWARYMDRDNNKTIYLPVTRDIVRLIAETDNTSYSWFPPANQRGTIDCINSRRNFRMAETDALYDNKVNPILSFPNDGVKAWGIKTMLDGDSQLTRIGVRRMMLRMKQLISRTAKQLIFTPNDATAAKTFVSIITPILDDIKSNRGISDYKLKVNDSIEARERRELPAQIWIKPIGMIEYIPIEFIITPEAVVWD